MVISLSWCVISVPGGHLPRLTQWACVRCSTVMSLAGVSRFPPAPMSSLRGLVWTPGFLKAACWNLCSMPKSWRISSLKSPTSTGCLPGTRVALERNRCE